MKIIKNKIMKNETLYNKTVNILVQAYFNDTLEAGSCLHCAVGNLVLANMYKNDRINQQKNHYDTMVSKWHDVFQSGRWFRGLLAYKGNAKDEIDSTGYSVYELLRIESAFEKYNPNTHYEISRSDDYMFNGLMAVIDVLDEIHENKDAAITSQTKEKFARV